MITSTSNNILDELFSMENVSTEPLPEIEPAPKRGPGVALTSTKVQQIVEPWVHTYMPLLDSTLEGDQGEPDPPSPFIMCPFGKHGHQHAGRQMCKSFRYLDEAHLQQVQSAALQYHLTSFKECTVPENHPPVIRRHSLFSLLQRGPYPKNIEEFYLDLSFATPITVIALA